MSIKHPIWCDCADQYSLFAEARFDDAPSPAFLQAGLGQFTLDNNQVTVGVPALQFDELAIAWLVHRGKFAGNAKAMLKNIVAQPDTTDEQSRDSTISFNNIFDVVTADPEKAAAFEKKSDLLIALRAAVLGEGLSDSAYQQIDAFAAEWQGRRQLK